MEGDDNNNKQQLNKHSNQSQHLCLKSVQFETLTDTFEIREENNSERHQ